MGKDCVRRYFPYNLHTFFFLGDRSFFFFFCSFFAYGRSPHLPERRSGHEAASSCVFSVTKKKCERPIYWHHSQRSISPLQEHTTTTKDFFEQQIRTWVVRNCPQRMSGQNLLCMYGVRAGICIKNSANCTFFFILSFTSMMNCAKTRLWNGKCSAPLYPKRK